VTATTDKSTARLLKLAHQRVLTEWGATQFAKLGDRFQQALLAEAVMAIAALQDEDVPAERVRQLVVDGWLWASEQTYGS
jgi:hypothetical protein